MFLESLQKTFLLLNKKDVAIYGLFTLSRLALQALDLVAILLLGVLLSTMNSSESITSRSLGPVSRLIPVEGPANMLALIAGIYLGKSILSLLLSYWSNLFLARLESDISRSVASKLLGRRLKDFEELSPAEIQFLINEATQLAIAGVLHSWSTLFVEALLLLGVITIFFVTSPEIASVAMVFLAVTLSLFHLLLSARLSGLANRLRRSSVDTVQTVWNVISVFREARVAGQLTNLLSRLFAYRSRHAKDRALQRFAMGLPRAFIEASLTIGIAILVGWFLLFGDAEDFIGVAGVFLAGALRLMASIIPIQNSITELRLIEPRAVRARNLLTKFGGGVDEVASEVALGPCLKQKVPEHSLVAENLSFSFEESQRPALAEISFELPSKCSLAVVGESGAGKTTLAELILDLRLPTAGRIHTGERKISDSYRLALVPQKTNLIPGTLLQNITLEGGYEATDNLRLERALSVGQVGDFVSQLPDGLLTEVGGQADNLSGGQIQRIGVARALYCDPDLLVLDEATSALDPQTESAMVLALTKLRGCLTLVVVAHRLSLVQECDYVLMLSSGQAEFFLPKKDALLHPKFVELFKKGMDDS